MQKFYLNKVQQRAYIIDAVYAIHMLGRGTGKTEGILAPKLMRRVIEMPRATFLLVAATFQQILTRTLPPLVAGLERMGYQMGVHFLVGERPNKAWINQWNWQYPYRPPFDWKYTIVFWNGTVVQMVSQDRIGSTNGMSVDYILGDEAKLLNYERLASETFPANRGIVKAFENNIHHHGWTFTTDMPAGTSGRWLFNYMDSCDQSVATEILQTELILQSKIADRDRARNFSQKRLDDEIQLLKKYLNELRKEYVYFQSGSSLENLDVLGVKYIKNMMRDLNQMEMKTSILNMRPKAVEECFYANLDEEVHGYFAYDYSKFERDGYLFKHQANGIDVDADFDTYEPLHISLDYNKSITPMVVAQVIKDEIRVINSFYSLYPEKLTDTVKKFASYYKNAKNREVFFWHDHTTINEYAHVEGTQADQVIAALESEGFCVRPMYTGKASNHERRYTMYANLFDENTYTRKLRINRDRCKYLLLSMFGTATIRRQKGFGKDKSTELKANIPAEEATHFSEALDMMIWGLLESGLSYDTIGSNEIILL